MITQLNGGLKRILRNIRSGKILNQIGAGKRVFFENPMEKIAFKYIPGEIVRISKYYTKHYGQEEYEIDCDSNSILTAVMEGKPISKAKYNHYELIEGFYWNLSTFNTPMKSKAMGF